MEENRVNIGELDTLVGVVAFAQTRGNRGQKVFESAEYGQVYAKLDWRIDEMSSDDNMEEQQSVDVTIYKIRNLTTRWQIRIEGQLFDIVSIDPISRWSPLCTLTCTASVQ